MDGGATPLSAKASPKHGPRELSGKIGGVIPVTLSWQRLKALSWIGHGRNYGLCFFNLKFCFSDPGKYLGENSAPELRKVIRL